MAAVAEDPHQDRLAHPWWHAPRRTDVEALNATFAHLIDDKLGAARNIRMAMASMFKWASKKKIMSAGVPPPQLDKTPKSQIKDYRQSMSELRTMVRGLDVLQDIDRDIMRLQFFTGTRISEALGAEWSKIDLEHPRRPTHFGQRLENDRGKCRA